MVRNPSPTQNWLTAAQRSPSPLLNVIQIMSGLDGLIDMSTNKTMIKRSVKSMKSRVWFRMAAIPDARWSCEGLDERENIEEALVIIEIVINIFEYLRQPSVQGILHDMHNHIWVEIDIFDDAIQALYQHEGQSPPEWKLANIWREYAASHYQYIASQARAWIFKRLLVLHTAWKDHFITVMQSGTQLNETQTTVKIDHYALMVLNKILDLYEDADFGVRFPIDGFSLLNGINKRLVSAINGKTPAKQLNRIYENIENSRVKALEKLLKLFLPQKEVEWRQVHPTPSFIKPVAHISCREFTHKQAQPEFENPLPLKIEAWVQDLSHHDTAKFGFVIYRVSYSQSNEQLEAGLNKGWDSLVEAGTAQKKATLEWVDRRNYKIAEGDLDAVRRNLQESVVLNAFLGMCSTVCLAVTSESVESFGLHSVSDHTFIHAIDPTTAASDGPGDAEDYGGMFRITDQLIWTDLYALHVHESCQTWKEFWSLAAEHPDKIYVGPITGVKRKQWRKKREALVSQASESHQAEDAIEI